MNNSKAGKAIRNSLLAVALSAVFAGTALATGAVDFTSTPLARGTMTATVHFKAHIHGSPKAQIAFETKGAVVINTVMITVKPGGSSGWHSHPGFVLVTVKQGAVTFYDTSCSPTVYPEGTSFVESADDGPGLARNEGTIDYIAYATFVAPPGTTAFRIDEANPGCPQS